MAPWSPYPHPGEYQFDAAGVTRHWQRLHAGDAEPLPSDPALLDAWALLHSGQFEQAARAGLAAGGAGITLANKATCLYASHLEQSEQVRLELLLEAARRAEAQAAAEPDNPNAWYWQAYALGRYSQGISVAKALAQGLGDKVRQALERAIALQPRHAEAHLALGAYHAEVIDKVGALIGGMTHGANRETGLRMFRQALQLAPQSPAAMLEYANGLLMLQGEAAEAEAQRLYEQAAALEPLDAVERLHVDTARMELLDG